MNQEKINDALEAVKESKVSEMAVATLKSLESGFEDYQKSVDKLGVVLEDLVNMLDADGTGIDVYLLHYVADARQSLRSVVQIIDTGCSISE